MNMELLHRKLFAVGIIMMALTAALLLARLTRFPREVNAALLSEKGNIPTTGASPTPVVNSSPNWSGNISRADYDRDKDRYAAEAQGMGRTVGTGANDGWLWTKTRAALTTAAVLRDSTFNVDVNNAVVMLSGTVDNAAQKAEAEKIVKNVEGVKSVVSKIVVSAANGNSKKNVNRSGNKMNLFGFYEPGLLMAFFQNNISLGKPKSVIEWEWAKEMELKNSSTLKISIFRTTDLIYKSLSKDANRLIKSEQPVPVGTPDVPLNEAFGPDYEAYAKSDISAAAFKVEGSTKDFVSLNSGRVDWLWSLMPENEGNQEINLIINCQWKQKGGDKIIGPYQVFSDVIQTKVTKPYIKTTTIDISMLISGISGSTLFAIGGFFYNKVKKRREDKEFR